MIRFALTAAMTFLVAGDITAWAEDEAGAGASVVPTDNPVAAHYRGDEGYPAWTDRINWSRVIDMSRYENGRTEFERFENARDELHAAGGGVLYYPAGTYDFSDRPAHGPHGRGLMLRSGVVIRGQAPVAERRSALGEDGLHTPTRFVLGFQERGGGQVPLDWNLIGIMASEGERLADVRDVGVVSVTLEGGVVYFGPDFDWGEGVTWGNGGSWRSAFVKDRWRDRIPDGTHPGDPFMAGPVVLRSNGGRDPDGTPFSEAPGIEPQRDASRLHGAGRGRLVFGCRLESAAFLNDFDNAGRKESPEGFGPDGFHMARYVARISVYGSQVLVANNHLPIESRRHFTHEQTTVRTSPVHGRGQGNAYQMLNTRRSVVLFDYGRTMGIDVNKDLLTLLQAPLREDFERGFHEPGVAILDNRVANHGHKGFNLSGRWMVVRRNHNDRALLRSGQDPYGIGGWILTLDGFVESSAGGGGMISDNYTRAFDMAGRDLWIDSNYYENLGSWPGNDGEGILCQNHNGTFIRSWAITRNRHEQGGGKSSYIGGWGVGVQGLLIAWNRTAGGVGMFGGAMGPSNIAVVGNRAGEVNVPRRGAITSNPSGRLVPPDNITTRVVDDVAVRIEWRDRTDAEIGYRVDRSIDGGPWTAIAYRPPQMTSDPRNEPVWIDYLAPAEKALRYRVVAINSNDGDEGASESTPVVRLDRPRPD
ncbi:MAG: hypothetical protein JJU36_01680 [Phycisphaeraceae bacterium]|nr:hypothetical protein [Phycisphaeraceae bacterium]